MPVIQGVLDKNAVTLNFDGPFTAGRIGNRIAVTFPFVVNEAFVLGTTTLEFQDRELPPQPVTIIRKTDDPKTLIFLLDREYGLSFRVDVPTPQRRKPAKKKAAKKK